MAEEQLNLLKTNNEYNFHDFNKQHEIKNFIKLNYTDMKCDKKLNVVSLFSGCGGLDLGFNGGFKYLNKYYGNNPYNIIWANELLSPAVKTYKENFNNKIVNDDISNINKDDLPDEDKVDIVIGGFPCQDFSLAGKRKGLTVKRGRLYLEMKRVIDITKPKAFVAENVKNLLIMENGLILKTIIDDFQSSGYKVKFHLFHAANYGVPQSRQRLIIYGIRNDISESEIYLPKETNSKENWVTSYEAIDDLWNKIGNKNILNHSQKSFSKAKFHQGKKTQGNIRIKPNKVAPTIRSEHHGNIEGHYRTYGDATNVDNWRRLTIRECARIQSFPDNFYFPVSTSNAYKQVGNAVPPVLGWHIARSLYKSLNKKR